jgi:type III secretory pathway component EscS
LAKPKPAIRHANGQVHWIAFALMLVRGAISAISLKGAASIPLGIAAAIVGTVILLLLILAAIQQRNSDLAMGVRRLVYVTLAFYVASGLASFAVSSYIALQLGPRATSQTMITDNPMLKAYGLVDLIGFLALGCTGLILMWRHQRSVRTPPPLELGNGG